MGQKAPLISSLYLLLKCECISTKLIVLYAILLIIANKSHVPLMSSDAKQILFIYVPIKVYKKEGSAVLAPSFVLV